MSAKTLKELIKEYGLPLDVKKPRWFGDYFFRAEKQNSDGKVYGTIYLNGSSHEYKSFSNREEMLLCSVQTVEDADYDEDSEDRNERTYNPNHLELDKSKYIKGVTRVFIKKADSVKPAVFDHFAIKGGQDVIYVIQNGAEKAGFYAFPNSPYVFPNKDDAQGELDKESRKSYGISPSQAIVAAFETKPIACKPVSSQQDEIKHEQDYHNGVNNQLLDNLKIPAKKREEAQYDLAHADEDLREEIVAAREGGYRLDDHTYISYQLKKETADARIESARREISQIETVRRKPYFARIDCGSSMKKLHTVYLGDEDIPGLVVSWRNPEYGNAYYQSNILQSRSDIVLALKRIISISNASFEGFEDEINLYQKSSSVVDIAEPDYASNADALLTRLLIQSRADKHAHDIIKTIQSEQYDIITSDFKRNAVVNGCAGSGKTMIMYHRLSYMAYNYQAYLGKQFNPSNVHIISPSSFFDLSNDELLTKLSIESVRQAPFYSHIDNLLDRYCAKYDIVPFYGIATYLEAKGQHALNFFSADEYSKFISNVATVAEETRAFRQWIISIANFFLKTQGFEEIPATFAPKSLSDIHSTFNTATYYYNECFSKANSTSLNRGTRRLYSPQAITSISLDNVLMSLKTKDKASSTYKQRHKKISKTIDILRCCLSRIPKKDINSNISSDINDFWNLVSNTTMYEKMLSVIVAEKLLECLVQGKSQDATWVLRCLWVYKDIYSGAESEYIKLYILKSLTNKYGPIVEDDALIFIDEFQNYSLFEISCLKEAYATPVFNLFGDYDQRIEEKGTDLKYGLSALLSPYSYNINVNYRNAQQITEYINKVVHKNMQSIGVSGSVEETTLQNCSFEIANRTAIICKNPQLATIFLKRYITPSLINNSNVTKEIVADRYTLMSVLDCKGLEFDTVYVLDYDMTENERYVAYTRALDKLVVISDNLEELRRLEEEEKRRQQEEEKQRRKNAREATKRQGYYQELISVLSQALEMKRSKAPRGERVIATSSKPKQSTPFKSEQELKLEAELRRIKAYRRELEHNAELSRSAEIERKEKIYSLAQAKVTSEDILVLTEAIVLLETIIDYKNAVELIAKLRVKIANLTTRQSMEKERYRSQGVCQYCGGKFKGLFVKRCRICGKNKDY